MTRAVASMPTEVLTPQAMQRLERAAMERGEVTGLALMERAGKGVVAGTLEAMPDLAAGAHRAAVFCGPGNNGGDGYVVARLLAGRGWTVELYRLGDEDRLPPDARANALRWREAGGASAPFSEALGGFGERPVELVVDAVFGTGLARRLDPSVGRPLADALAWSRRSGRRLRVVAVDLPSGLCGHSGRDLGVPLPADLTVTFHRAKTGHFLGRGPDFCGALKVVDIGLPPAPAPAPGEIHLARPHLAGLGKERQAHKYSHGHVLVLTGGEGRTGAARLAARAALRAGAGLVTLGVPDAARAEVAGSITALMMRRVNHADDLEALLEDRRYTALCLGPGLGTGPREAALVAAALAAGRPTVLDADALTILGQAPGCGTGRCMTGW